MVHSTEGKGPVVIDVMHDACLGGAPGCFGVQRVDAKVFGRGEHSERVFLFRSPQSVLRLAVRLLLALTISSTFSLAIFWRCANPTITRSDAGETFIFVVCAGLLALAL